MPANGNATWQHGMAQVNRAIQEPVAVVGHHIGLMIAYAYPALAVSLNELASEPK